MCSCLNKQLFPLILPNKKISTKRMKQLKKERAIRIWKKLQSFIVAELLKIECFIKKASVIPISQVNQTATFKFLPLPQVKGRHPYSHCHAKSHFGGWVGFMKTCVTIYCGEMLKRHILPAPTTRHANNPSWQVKLPWTGHLDSTSKTQNRKEPHGKKLEFFILKSLTNEKLNTFMDTIR